MKRLRAGFVCRDARLADLSGIIKIVNSKNNRKSFGFVPKVVLADAVQHQDAEGAASKHLIKVVVTGRGRNQRVVAWTRSYHRRDGVTSLHELGVAEDCQSTGIGSYLVNLTIAACKKRGMSTLRLKTPQEMRSNGYYPRFGFKCVGTDPGHKRTLNVYELNLSK